MLVIKFGFKAYEIDYSDLVDYEMVIAPSTRKRTISSKNKESFEILTCNTKLNNEIRKGSLRAVFFECKKLI